LILKTVRDAGEKLRPEVNWHEMKADVVSARTDGAEVQRLLILLNVCGLEIIVVCSVMDLYKRRLQRGRSACRA
jgi:hypothetical protein